MCLVDGDVYDSLGLERLEDRVENVLVVKKNLSVTVYRCVIFI